MGQVTNLPNQGQLRVLAADSSAMSTQLLVEALARNSQFVVVEAPSDASEILNLVKREKPEIVLVSAKLGQSGLGSFELVRSIRSQSPAPRVIVLLDHSEPKIVVQAFRAGAHGIFCRTEPFQQLSKCIECVHDGQVWANSTELHFLLEALAQPGNGNFHHLAQSPLSARESDVVRCVAEGLTNREIAHRLKLTEHTVKNYLFRIFDKLGVSSRVEVVLYALGNGEPRTIAPQGGRRSGSSAATRKQSTISSTAHKTGD